MVNCWGKHKSIIIFKSMEGKTCSSQCYFWNISDILGNGATSTVYTGRSKRNGTKVAVKVFNNSSFMRPGDVQDREFEVLTKLNHKNIVQLLAIEIDRSTRQRVIIMELCNRGSLHTMLLEPVYAFGFPEQEYKKILSDISSGMKYLMDKKIVHRDLKPGNIMVLDDKDGQNVYKLADFGSARKLSNEECFQSLYGTEEYLHPDVYERALLNQQVNKSFNISVDLWSIGVTLYHVATGLLPFRPFGGRANRQTMFFLTTKKKSGVISGVQTVSKTGPITWRTTLPEKSPLSSMFQRMWTPILAGLLEHDSSKIMSCEEFFNKVDTMLDMRMFDVFNVQSGQMLKIYHSKKHEYCHFQESVKQQTGIEQSDQLLIFELTRFRPSTACEDFPVTTEKNPIIVFPKKSLEARLIALPVFGDVAQSSTPFDCHFTKMSSAILLQHQQSLSDMINAQNLLKMSVTAFRFATLGDLRLLVQRMSDVENSKVRVESSLQAVKIHLSFMDQLTHILQVSQSETGNSMQLQEIESLLKEIQEKHEVHTKELSALDQALNGEQLAPVLDKNLGCHPNHRCFGRFNVICQGALLINDNVRNWRHLKLIDSNTLQIVNLEKERLIDLCKEGADYLSNHCYHNLQIVHQAFVGWYKEAQLIAERITMVTSKIDWLEMKYSDLQQNVEKVKEDLLKRQEMILSRLKVADQTSQLESCDFEIIPSLETQNSDPMLSPNGYIQQTSFQPPVDRTTSNPRRQLQVRKVTKECISKPAPDARDELCYSNSLMEMFEQEFASFNSRISDDLSSNSPQKSCTD